MLQTKNEAKASPLNIRLGYTFLLWTDTLVNDFSPTTYEV